MELTLENTWLSGLRLCAHYKVQCPGQGEESIRDNFTTPHGAQAGGRTRELVPPGPLTSHWVVSSLTEPFCPETRADLHPAHLQPLQSRPMDSSAPERSQVARAPSNACYSQKHTIAAISPPPLQACATQRKVGAGGVPSCHTIHQRP